MRALVVEDSPIVRQVVARTLEGKGFEVRHAERKGDCQPVFDVAVRGLDLPDARGDVLATQLLDAGVVGKAVLFTAARDSQRLASVIDADDQVELERCLERLASTLKRADVTASRVLVVDDDVLTVRATARLLRARGHRVSTAGSIGDAVEIVTRERVRFDVAVLDIEMDTPTAGVDLARVLLRRGFVSRVVFHSGTTSAEVLEQAAQLGRVVPKGHPNTATWLVFDVENGTDAEGR
ncbi:MAG TPA: response regulator [Polyangiaceae bacterium]|nr:response regulator [Polyangiaceae bacterium]